MEALDSVSMIRPYQHGTNFWQNYLNSLILNKKSDRNMRQSWKHFNPLQSGVAYLYPLKTSENL